MSLKEAWRLQQMAEEDMRRRDKFDSKNPSIEERMEEELQSKYGHMDTGMRTLSDEQARDLINKSVFGKKAIDNDANPVLPFQDRITELIREGKLPADAALPEKDKLVKLKELGNRFNQGKLQWHLVPFEALEPMVKVLDYGAKKYALNQWKNGLSLQETLDSLLRHTFALLSGEVNDSESGLPHIGHVFCNALFYSYFTEVNDTNARD